MPGRFGPTDFAACGRCGSGQVHPKLLVMGPIAGVDSDSRSYVCHTCGHEGLPIFFDTESARAQFEREKKGVWEPEPASAKKGPVSIPILPIQTDPLVEIKLLDLLPARVATVTGVRWAAGALTPTRYRVSFQEYWDAIGGPRYNASRIYMLDLAGINRANPNFDVARHWLLGGLRDGPPAPRIRTRAGPLAPLDARGSRPRRVRGRWPAGIGRPPAGGARVRRRPRRSIHARDSGPPQDAETGSADRGDRPRSRSAIHGHASHGPGFDRTALRAGSLESEERSFLAVGAPRILSKL